MTLPKLKLSWIVGGLFILTFAFLLILRFGIFEGGEADHRGGRTLNIQARKDRETWMSIYQQGEKIGYAHRQFYGTFEGCRIVESVLMRMNIMGMVQDLGFKTEGNFDHDMTLSSFDFELRSNLFRFTARGSVKGSVLAVLAGRAGSEQKIDFPFEKGTGLSVSILERLMSEDLKRGESRTFHIFDPTTAVHQPVKVSILTEETISIMGRQEKAKKVSVHFMGVPHFAWIGEDGSVLKEEGALGIRLEQVTKEEALRKIRLSSGTDLAEVASIPANKALQDVSQLEELKLRLKGIEEGNIFLNGGRQSFKGNILAIRRESISDLRSSIKREKPFEDGKTYLESTPFIQVEHPEIQAKAREIVSPNDSRFVKAKKLVAWVNENIQKRPVLSIPNALETLQHRVGDCNEHAVLLAALARASGIPAQVEAGLVYQRGRFYYHAWNALYLGTWVTADSVMGQLPADVTHIRFVRGTEGQIDLVRLIGKVKIEIVSYE
jgi:hypothetical protein